MGRGTGAALEETFDLSDTVRGSALASEWREEEINYVLEGFASYFKAAFYTRQKIWADIAQHREHLPILKDQQPERWERLIRELAIFTVPRPYNSSEADPTGWVSSRIDETGFRLIRSPLIVGVQGGRGTGSQSNHLRIDLSAETALCGLPVEPRPGTFDALSRARCKKCQAKLVKLIAAGGASDELAALVDDRNRSAIEQEVVDQTIAQAETAIEERLLVADLPADAEQLREEITALAESEFRQLIADQAATHLYKLSADDRLARLTFNSGKPNYLNVLRAAIERAYGSPCPWPSEEEMVGLLKEILSNNLWHERQQAVLAHLSARLFPKAVSELTAIFAGMNFDSTVEKIWKDNYPELLPDSNEPQLIPV